MAKINHYSNNDVILELFTDAKQRNIMHLQIDEGNVFGNRIHIQNRVLKNFGTCGYMGLENDPRVIAKSVEFTKKYGMQYSVSRAYASTGINELLEEKIGQIYGKPAIVYPSTSKAHISIIPTVVSEEDAVILDQQVHLSVQTAVQLLRQKGTTIDMIRHSNLEMLERKIKELGNKYQKIWYMIDGIYSMYGDAAPMKELSVLLEKHPQLHLYIDDAHGMSWTGKNGGGFVFEETGILDKMILVSTMAKGFGAVGGIGIFPNRDLWWSVRAYGGPLTYSHPLTPAVLGASLAIADIHLSDEIYTLQKELKDKINYCHNALQEKGLPILSKSWTPIKYIGAGKPQTGYNMMKGILDDGYFINIGIFPAVSVKCTGIRFTITRHQTYEDIDGLVASIHRNYHRALKEEKITDTQVRKAFKLSIQKKEDKTEHLHYYTSINQIDKEEWDSIYKKEGSYDYDGMQYLEKAFSNNPDKHNNWEFFYFIKRGKDNKIKLASFFTLGIYKDDFLSPENISRQAEEKRIKDPYYLTSKTLAMGSMLTIGNHLYIDKTESDWKERLNDFIQEIEILREKVHAETVLLRDFPTEDTELCEFFTEKGFVKIAMPNNNVIDIRGWQSKEEFWEQLSRKRKKNFNQDVRPYINAYEIEYKTQLSPEEIVYAYELFMNISKKNYAINIFPYPIRSLEAMNEFDRWEFIELSTPKESDKAVAYIMCYKGHKSYIPMFMGMDYHCSKQPYKQALYQIVLRAKSLGYDFIELGLSADMDKRKFGAEQQKICSYIQAQDNYNLELLASMGNSN